MLTSQLRVSNIPCQSIEMSEWLLLLGYEGQTFKEKDRKMLLFN